VTLIGSMCGLSDLTDSKGNVRTHVGAKV
jgi:hypothetical protein